MEDENETGKDEELINKKHSEIFLNSTFPCTSSRIHTTFPCIVYVLELFASAMLH